MIVKDTISNASDDVSDIVASMQTFEPLEVQVAVLCDSFFFLYASLTAVLVTPPSGGRCCHEESYLTAFYIT